MMDRSVLHDPEHCICAQGAGESYCNCGVAAALERGSTLCTGYYRCQGCEERPAALAALTLESPLASDEEGRSDA